jgi:hypothetical protein
LAISIFFFNWTKLAAAHNRWHLSALHHETWIISKTHLVRCLKIYNYLSHYFYVWKLFVILSCSVNVIVGMQCSHWLAVCNGLACCATWSPSILGSPLVHNLAKSLRSEIFLHVRSI